MKKLISLLLALMMVLSLATVAFASEEGGENNPATQSGNNKGSIDDTRGSITINDITIENGKPTATYEIYQLLKLMSYDFNSSAYVYEYTNDAWKTFFTTGEGKDYIGKNEQNQLVWKASNDAETVATFARIALKYAQENNIAPTKTTVTAEGATAQYETVGNSSIKFSELELGYYLVDSSVGALCGLSSTNPDGLINSKNGAPSIEKQVQEDLTQQWGTTNSADIGQTVNFRTTVHVHAGAQNYVLHDIMEAGLTFDPNSISVKLVTSTSGAEGTPVNNSNYTIKTKVGLTKETEDDITTADCNAGCTFEIHFENTFCKTLNTNDRLIITYSAMLNRNADIGNSTTDNPANKNTTKVEYGEHHFTSESSTTTTTYAIDLVKTDGQNKLIPGAKFKIFDAKDGGNEIKVVRLTDATTGDEINTADGYPMYRRARADESGVEIDVTNGLVRIIGFDNGTYWLEETEEPDGYTAISGRQSFTISDNNLDAKVENQIVYTNSGVQVINHSGTMLPETGATGTAMFIAFGMFTVLSTGVLLVTKKRMSMIEE